MILIHPGNEPKDTKGCLLPGTARLTDKVTNSVAMYNKIKQLMVRMASLTLKLPLLPATWTENYAKKSNIAIRSVVYYGVFK
ncbi:DUF5675 family protein [Mixta intestinalis]|uniref:DUF5675 family protein n=1 Tax=Mixta intestinalis TaxID=1615494 RepID=UPI001FCA6D14|nr:DUF5675 family protein [Mixta intestinalis]